jgi:hypothetical protein
MFWFRKSKERRRVVGDYRRPAGRSKEECLKFLTTNYRRICKYHSFNTFKEFTLNYRILFDRTNKNKIIHDYKKYILTKKTYHKSNMAISYNMITQICVDAELEQKIIEFMHTQLEVKSLEMFRSTDTYFLKKHMIMQYVKDNLLKGKPI